VSTNPEPCQFSTVVESARGVAGGSYRGRGRGCRRLLEVPGLGESDGRVEAPRWWNAGGRRAVGGLGSSPPPGRPRSRRCWCWLEERAEVLHAGSVQEIACRAASWLTDSESVGIVGVDETNASAGPPIGCGRAEEHRWGGTAVAAWIGPDSRGRSGNSVAVRSTRACRDRLRVFVQTRLGEASRNCRQELGAEGRGNEGGSGHRDVQWAVGRNGGGDQPQRCFGSGGRQVASQSKFRIPGRLYASTAPVESMVEERACRGG
jgi:hypothetical protein